MICFFIGDISRSGGTERVTTVIASSLADRGHDVAILSIQNGEHSCFPLSANVRLHSLHLEGRSANFSDFTKWRKLRHFVREHRVDVVVDVDVILSWYSIPAACRLPTKVVSWEHFHRHINVGDFGQRLRRSLGRKLALRCAAALVTLTERDRAQYLEADGCHVPVIAIPNPMTMTPRLGPGMRGPVVLAAGRLVPQKGFDRLLAAWGLIASEVPAWRLRIVGSGPDEVSLRHQAQVLGIANSVELVPSTNDMASEYLAASIYVMSSRFEGLPLVLVEAKGFALPLISFDCACGPSDIVRPGVDGVLVPDGDVAKLAFEMQALILDEPRRARFASESLNDSRFTLAPIVRQWEALLTGGRNESGE